jgi:hypothetical protein
MSMGDLGDLSNLDSATLLKYLPGVRFPAEKEQIASRPPRATEPRRSWCSRSGTRAATASTVPTRSCRRYKAANNKKPPALHHSRLIIRCPRNFTGREDWQLQN